MTSTDFWTPDGLYHHHGKTYGLDQNCRTVVVVETLDESLSSPDQSELKVKPILPDTPAKLSVTKNRTCIVCGTEFSSKREDARFCSPNCRQIASRKNRQLVLVT